MTTAAYPAIMTADPCLRGDSGHTNFWSNYNGSAHLSNRLSSAMDPGFHNSTSVSPLPARLRSSHDPSSYSYGRCSQEDPAPYDRHLQPSLSAQQSQHTYPTLKRPYSQTEPAPYQEMVQDLRDERLSVSQDLKLLSFRRAQDKHTIVDQQGRMQQLELSAQLHGMFFLSEMPSTASDGTTLQPELTCYRRNLFQISGSLITPRGQLSIINESNETVAVSNLEVAVSAIESVDGNSVRLIVIPWKTPPPNTPEINQGPDQEPSSLPLIPFQSDSTEPEGEYAVYPIGWRRLQFRIATANNGRRKELQQHFVLHLKVYGTVADGSKVVLSEVTTAPIVVRGRSPRNFQARKEIPLLGSCAGSRGQPLVETGVGVLAGTCTLSVKPQELKRPVDNGIQLPRSNFSYGHGSSKMPSVSQLSSMRPSAFPSWSTNSTTPMPQMTTSSPGSYSSVSTGNETYPKAPLSTTSHFNNESQDLPLQTSIPSLALSMGPGDQSSSSRGPSSYSYLSSSSSNHFTNTSALSSHESSMSVPRYVDSGRPSKSSRSIGQQSVHSNGSSSPSEYRYGPPSAPSSSGSRDYYPSSSTWSTSTSGETSSTGTYSHSDGRPYSYSHDHYKVSSSNPGAVKLESRGYDPLSHYSWNPN